MLRGAEHEKSFITLGPGCTNITLKKLQNFGIQSTLVISKSKGPSKTVRDIHTSTYQICSIEEKQFEQPIFTNDYVI